MIEHMRQGVSSPPTLCRILPPLVYPLSLAVPRLQPLVYYRPSQAATSIPLVATSGQTHCSSSLVRSLSPCYPLSPQKHASSAAYPTPSRRREGGHGPTIHPSHPSHSHPHQHSSLHHRISLLVSSISRRTPVLAFGAGLVGFIPHQYRPPATSPSTVSYLSLTPLASTLHSSSD